MRLISSVSINNVPSSLRVSFCFLLLRIQFISFHTFRLRLNLGRHKACPPIHSTRAPCGLTLSRHTSTYIQLTLGVALCKTVVLKHLTNIGHFSSSLWLLGSIRTPSTTGPVRTWPTSSSTSCALTLILGHFSLLSTNRLTRSTTSCSASCESTDAC